MSDRKIETQELEVFENELGSICIKNSDGDFVYFDESAAEKICKFIMDVALEIRGKNNG